MNIAVYWLLLEIYSQCLTFYVKTSVQQTGNPLIRAERASEKEQIFYAADKDRIRKG